MKHYEPLSHAVPTNGRVLKIRRTGHMRFRGLMRLLWAWVTFKDVEIACIAAVDENNIITGRPCLTVRPLPYISGDQYITAQSREGWKEC